MKQQVDDKAAKVYLKKERDRCKLGSSSPLGGTQFATKISFYSEILARFVAASSAWLFDRVVIVDALPSPVTTPFFRLLSSR